MELLPKKWTKFISVEWGWFLFNFLSNVYNGGELDVAFPKSYPLDAPYNIYPENIVYIVDTLDTTSLEVKIQIQSEEIDGISYKKFWKFNFTNLKQTITLRVYRPEDSNMNKSMCIVGPYFGEVYMTKDQDSDISLWSCLFTLDTTQSYLYKFRYDNDDENIVGD